MDAIPDHTLRYLDSWLALRSKYSEYPGFAVAIAHNDKIIFNHSYGYASLETKQPLTPAHMFRLASQSKMLTAVALLQLHEGGRLNIEEAASNYLPWMSRCRDGRWCSVTIRQLMGHMAGIVRDGDSANFWQLTESFPDNKKIQSIVTSSRLVFDPGGVFKYSNVGYAVLGEIIETVSEMDYSSYIAEYIVNPLKLTIQTDYTPGALLSIGHSVIGQDRRRSPYTHPITSRLAPATGLCATVADMARFMSALRFKSGVLMSDATKNMMYAVPQNLGVDGKYALGIELYDFNDKRVIGHSGGFPGFHSRSWLRLDDGLAVSVAVNATDGNANAIARTLFGIIDKLGKDDPPASLMRFEGRFTNVFGVYDIVACRDGLYGLSSNSWDPLLSIDILQVVDDETLCIAETNPFMSRGEEIKYQFNEKNELVSISLAGLISPALLME